MFRCYSSVFILCNSDTIWSLKPESVHSSSVRAPLEVRVTSDPGSIPVRQIHHPGMGEASPAHWMWSSVGRCFRFSISRRWRFPEFRWRRGKNAGRRCWRSDGSWRETTRWNRKRWWAAKKTPSRDSRNSSRCSTRVETLYRPVTDREWVSTQTDRHVKIDG